MKRGLVYDVPTRLFHWIFAVLFLTTFVITKTVDDESPTFSLHMLAGLTLVFSVILRIIWGFAGTRYARFGSFALNPKDLIQYFKGIFKGDLKRWAGHNPASSWAAILMWTMALGLGVSGYLMASGTHNEILEEAHELLANGFFVVTVLHVAGVVLHMVRHKDGLGFSMIHGEKQTVEGASTIPSSRPFAGMVFLAIVAVFAVNLFNNYDSQKRTLNLFGTTLTLGEVEEAEGNEGAEEGENGEAGESGEGEDLDD